MKMRALLCLGAALLLCSCDPSSITINYNLTEPVDVSLYTEGYFSTLDLNGEERLGTVTATYVDLHYSQDGDSLKVDRKYKGHRSRGYLKHSMPSELAWRISNVSLAAIDDHVKRLDGYDEGYDSVVTNLLLAERWRKQLLNKDYIPHLKRIEKHRWEMDHLIVGEIPTKGNITQLLKDRKRLNFGLITVDSVVVKGFENRDHRRCLDYVVYLHERESFPYYIWEQHVNSKIVPEKFQQYNTGLQATYDVKYEVMMDPSTGIPCQEREVKVGTHTMVNPVSQDTATFTSYVTYERLYNIIRENAENNE
ncbi:MAG: hypothetical protein MJY87_07040 [Fibrobacter sp.]|nr:hypothetical protein [Fibrobacter sp.]